MRIGLLHVAIQKLNIIFYGTGQIGSNGRLACSTFAACDADNQDSEPPFFPYSAAASLRVHHCPPQADERKRTVLATPGYA